MKFFVTLSNRDNTAKWVERVEATDDKDAEKIITNKIKENNDALPMTKKELTIIYKSVDTKVKVKV